MKYPQSPGDKAKAWLLVHGYEGLAEALEVHDDYGSYYRDGAYYSDLLRLLPALAEAGDWNWEEYKAEVKEIDRLEKIRREEKLLAIQRHPYLERLLLLIDRSNLPPTFFGGQTFDERVFMQPWTEAEPFHVIGTFTAANSPACMGEAGYKLWEETRLLPYTTISAHKTEADALEAFNAIVKGWHQPVFRDPAGSYKIILHAGPKQP